MKWMRPLGNMVIPSALFYIIYHAIGISLAVIVSLAYSVLTAMYAKRKGGTVKNSQIVGAVGLAASAAAMTFTGEEKLYYVPKLVENVVFLGFMAVLSGRRKSVLHYLAKDFEIASLQEVPESSMLSVNIVWMAYFALKIISKIAGVLYLDFDKLYWVVFFLGDPMTAVVVVLSVVMIRKKLQKEGGGYE